MGVPLRATTDKATRQTRCHLTGALMPRSLELPRAPSASDTHVTPWHLAEQGEGGLLFPK